MKNAVVLVSGGMDSAVVLALAREQGFAVHALSVRYGQRHTSELEAADRVSSVLGAVAHKTVNVDLRSIGGSALTDDIEVPESGGGGIPVVDPGDGNYEGIAAVVDKDYASSLLARELKADLFVISTAIEKVAVNFGKPEQKWLDRITLAEAKAYLAEGIHFAKGSMAPKIQAVIWYLENGGKEALITNPENIGRALKGETGTWIVA